MVWYYNLRNFTFCSINKIQNNIYVTKKTLQVYYKLLNKNYETLYTAFTITKIYH